MPIAAEAELTLAEWVVEVGDRLRDGPPPTLTEFESRDRDLAKELAALWPVIHSMAAIPSVNLAPEQVIGDYTIVREIGRGGMGIVFEAIQSNPRRPVALKVMPCAVSADPRGAHRFRNESQAAGTLHHANIVSIYESGIAGGVAYFAMQLIDGCNLSKIRDNLLAAPQSLPRSEAVWPWRVDAASSYPRAIARLGSEAARALDFAHQSKIIHRDVKPSNLMIDRQGKLWVTDFGLARIQSESEFTQTGEAVGTLRYASPEQVRGVRGDVDARADVYSLGATLYELLTLRPAFEDEDRVDLIHRVATVDPTPLRRIDPTIPRDLETIVLKAMSKDRSDRYASAAAMADDLDHFLGDRPIQARRPRGMERVVRTARRHPRLAAAVTITSLIFVFATGATLRAVFEQRRLIDQVVKTSRAEYDQRLKSFADARLSRQTYIMHIHKAVHALEVRDVEGAQRHLIALVPPLGGEDQRDFSWYHVAQRAFGELVPLGSAHGASTGVALSEDGKSFVSLHDDGAVELWDLASGCVITTLTTNAIRPRLPALSPDHGLVAFEAADESDGKPLIEVWDLRTKQRFLREPLTPAPDNACRGTWHFAGDRRLILPWHSGSGSALRVIDLSDCATNGAGEAVELAHAVAIAPNRTAIATWTQENVVVHELRENTWRFVPIPARALSPSRVFALSASAEELAFEANNSEVVVVSTATGLETARYGVKRPLTQLAFSPDGETLAAADQAGSVVLWTRAITHEKIIPSNESRGGRVDIHIEFSPNGRRLVASPCCDTPAQVGGRQPITIIDVATGDRLATLRLENPSLQHPVFTRDARSVVMAGSSVRIWNFEHHTDVAQPLGHLDEGWSAAFNHDCTLLATGSDDTTEHATIKLWDPSSGALLRSWYGGNGTVASLAFSPDGRTLASGHLAKSNNVRLWDVDSGKPRATFSGHADSVRAVRFSPDGKILASAGYEGIVRLWDMSGPPVRAVLPGHTGKIYTLDFTPDGKTLISGGNDPALRYWDVEKGVLIEHIPTLACGGAALSSRGDMLATTGSDLPITVWDTSTRQPLSVINTPHAVLRRLAISPDGMAVASVDEHGIIRLWDVATGQEILAIHDFVSEQVNALVFAPDGSSLVACAHNGVVKIWRAGAVRSLPAIGAASVTVR